MLVGHNFISRPFLSARQPNAAREEFVLKIRVAVRTESFVRWRTHCHLKTFRRDLRIAQWRRLNVNSSANVDPAGDARSSAYAAVIPYSLPLWTILVSGPAPLRSQWQVAPFTIRSSEIQPLPGLLVSQVRRGINRLCRRPQTVPSHDAAAVVGCEKQHGLRSLVGCADAGERATALKSSSSVADTMKAVNLHQFRLDRGSGELIDVTIATLLLEVHVSASIRSMRKFGPEKADAERKKKMHCYTMSGEIMSARESKPAAPRPLGPPSIRWPGATPRMWQHSAEIACPTGAFHLNAKFPALEARVFERAKFPTSTAVCLGGADVAHVQIVFIVYSEAAARPREL